MQQRGNPGSQWNSSVSAEICEDLRKDVKIRLSFEDIGNRRESKTLYDLLWRFYDCFVNVCEILHMDVHGCSGMSMEVPMDAQGCQAPHPPLSYGGGTRAESMAIVMTTS